MKQRIEDLGRLGAMLDQLLEMNIFDFYHGRNKDFAEQFYEWSPEKQEDILHNLIYGLSDLSDKLHVCREIAYGLDDINYQLDNPIL